MKKSLGIYLHIPFCVQKCRYCDFCSFSEPTYRDREREYARMLCKLIGERSFDAGDYEIDTVYFGGGTPSLMSEGSIGAILDSIRTGYSLKDGAEITLECNPATADKKYFKNIRSMGVNRLSMGLQSALDTELSLLGRIHTAEDFRRTFFDAREADFDNISADLMYGIPNQTVSTLMRSAEYLCGLFPEHISAYGLTLEEGTYMHRHREELVLADGDGQYEMYSMLSQYLPSRGYRKYEISNFSKAGRESAHNLRYWRCGEYLGFGVAAHSYFAGERFGCSRDMEAFLSGEDIVCERSYIGKTEAAEEYLMLGMRLVEGVDIEKYAQMSGRELYSLLPIINKYVDGGLMILEGARLSFTERGFFVSNAIISELLG